MESISSSTWCLVDALDAELQEKDLVFNTDMDKQESSDTESDYITPDTETSGLEWDHFTPSVGTDFRHSKIRFQKDSDSDPTVAVVCGETLLKIRIGHLAVKNIVVETIETQSRTTISMEFQGAGASRMENGNTKNDGNHGVINYSFYNTHYQNSMDLSDFAGTSATNYGHDGGNTDNDITSGKWTNLLSAGIGALPQLLPLLADSKTEDVENSDRIDVRQAGTSTLVTQHTVGCRTYGPLPPVKLTSAADEPTLGTPAIERFYTIKLTDWTTTNVAGKLWALPLPGALLKQAQTVFSATARRHYLMNCGWLVQVQVNSTRFHGGALGVFMIPEYSQGANPDNFLSIREVSGEEIQTWWNWHQYFLYPHQIINPRTNSSAEIQVPYVNVAPGTDPTAHAPWTLAVVVLAPLTVSTGATTSLTVTVSVKPEHVRFHGLRLPNTEFEGPPIAQLHPSSGAFYNTAPFYSVPVYGKMVRSSVDFIPAEITDYLQLARIPTLATSHAVTFSSTMPAEPLLTVDVSLSATDLMNTTLGTVSRMFAQYRGSIKVVTCYVGNQMQNVRYLISYTPPGATGPRNVEEAMQGFYQICDTGLNTENQFVIPFISPVDYHYTTSSTATDVTVGGYLNIFQLNVLAVPPGSPSVAQLLVFFAAGEDFEFRAPTTPYMTTQGDPVQPGEIGVSAPQTAANSSEHPNEIPFSYGSMSHSNVKFWWDRFFWVDSFTLNPANASTYNYQQVAEINLTPSYLTDKTPELAFARHATYWRAELEIALLCDKNGTSSVADAALTMVWYPPGSRIPSGNVTPKTGTALSLPNSIRRCGAAPMAVGSGNRPLLLKIPYTSPLSAMPITFCGLDRFTSSTAKVGTAPGSTFGTLLITSDSSALNTPIGPLHLYVRFRDMQLWCPRPGQYTRLSTATTALRLKSIISEPTSVTRHTGASNEELLLQGGDIEPNPGPVFSKVWNDIGKLVSDKCCEGIYDLKNMFQTLTTFSKWHNLFDDEFKAKWLGRIFKAIGIGILTLRAASDPMLAAAAVFLLGGTWTAQICFKLKKYLGTLFKTPAPPIPGLSDHVKRLISQVSIPGTTQSTDGVEIAAEALDDTNPFKSDLLQQWDMQAGPAESVRELNNVFQLAKNAQWALQGLNEIKDWLNAWVRQEQESPEEILKQGLPNLEGFLQLHSNVKCQPAHPMWGECKEYFDKMRKAAAVARPQLLRMLPLMTKSQPALARPEPILVVLRGKPGQGKSVAATFLAQTLSKTLCGSAAYYSMNSSTKYMDGYNQEPVVLVDDLGQATDGADFQHFCQLISIAPFQVNKADLSDKGMVFTSSVIIATTNHPEFRPITLADPEALKRRINFDFHVSAGRAYQDVNGCLDLQRAVQPLRDNPMPNLLHHGTPLLTKECLAFKNIQAPTSQPIGLKEVFDRIMIEHKRRQTCSMQFDEMFLQGPEEEQPERPRLVQTLAAMQQPLRPVSATEIATAIKECFEELGHPNDPPKWQQVVSSLIMVLSFIIMLFSFFYMLNLIFQGPYSGEPQKKPQHKKAKLVDLSYEGPHATNVSMETALMRRNMVRVKCTRWDDGVFYTTGTFVKDRFMLMNWHLFERAKKLQPDYEFDVDNVVALRPTFHGIPSDLVLIQFPDKGRNYRDITHLFATKEECTIQPGITGKGLMMDESPFMFDLKPVLFADKIMVHGQNIPQVLRYQAQTSAGYCGSLVVVDWGTYKRAIGIHCAGAHGVGAAAVITKAGLDALINSEFQGQITDVKPHPFVYTPGKTAYYPTIVHDENTTVEPAALSCRDPRLVEPHLFKQSIMSKHQGNLETGPDAWVRSARLYARIVRSRIPTDVSKRLTIGEAIMGIPGLDPMDMSKSPGWPYIARGARRPDLVEIIQDGQVQLDKVVYAEIVNFLSGDFRNHKFVTFLKDETRPTEKVRAGKTRVIDVASLGHAITGRMLFGRLAAWMHSQNGVELGSAVGADPDSDWTRFASEFKYQNFADVDYSGFDASHTTFSFHCLKVFLKELGFDEVALAFIDSLAISKHIWDDEEYTLIGGLPSGCACTSIFNTILNNIIIRGTVPQLTEHPFQMLAYGDDLIICSYEKFDLFALKEFLAEHSLYKVTPAQKDGDLVWGKLSDMRFLKRSFVSDGAIVRPQMTKENLHNILSWARAGTISEKVISVSMLAVHSGPVVYEELFKPFDGTGVVVPPFALVNENFLDIHFSGQ
ncbi:polyprotein [malagasivirus B1]|uniref:Genome polyprotein n=8 Tax=malagasivirus B1 TaxID=1603964 RepID=A0A0B5GND3_9PICO|nr:polyprotein [malagasivirus B1]AJF23126.1 polyprotein [malagasivirus B1]